MENNYPTRLLALQQTASIAHTLEAEFIVKKGYRPMMAMLAYAKRDAAEAIADLVMEDDLTKVPLLQLRARQFNYLCNWLRQVKLDGDEADQVITDQDREILIEALSQQGPEGQRQLQEMGLVQGDDE